MNQFKYNKETDILWLDVVGYEGRYMVNPNGSVKSLERNIVRGGSSREVKVDERILKPCFVDGYHCVTLCKEGVMQKRRIHRIVAAAFLPNPENKSQINHKNGIKHDNRLSNLEWVTPSENVIHSYRVLGNVRNYPKDLVLSKHNHAEIIADYKATKSYTFLMNKYKISSRGTLSFIINKSMQATK